LDDAELILLKGNNADLEDERHISASLTGVFGVRERGSISIAYNGLDGVSEGRIETVRWMTV
jgi:hypothetical protein